MPRDIYIQGIPEGVPEPTAAVCRSRLITAVEKLLNETKLDSIRIAVGTTTPEPETQKSGNAGDPKKEKQNAELSPEDRARGYKAGQPLFNFEQLIVPQPVKDELVLAIDLVRLEQKVFDEWGLRKIEPFPRSALNFHGKPGTGKTLAAHAIATKIERPILVASYAQIESMYHGEGPKNVEAIFLAAERDNAVLFIDEADSLLSKRLTNVTQGSEQAINSMRSQLLVCLERFRGIVIFSTNLVTNYDKAFETRVRHVHFPMPDETCRQEIWKAHFPSELPLTADVTADRLAKIDDICGRDIKNAVIDAAMRVARVDKKRIGLSDLIDSVERIKASRINVKPENSREELSPEEKKEVEEKVKVALAKKEKETPASETSN